MRGAATNGAVGTLTFDVEDWEHADFPQLRGKEEGIRAAVEARRYAMDANTDRWIPSWTTANAASMIPRFGYTAIPAAK